MMKWGIGVATAALATAFAGGTAYAQGTYISLGAGWTRIDSADTRIENGISAGNDIAMRVDLDDDFSGRAALGWDLGDLRVEGEFGMTAGDANSYSTTSAGVVSRPLDGTLNLVTGMLNAYWDFGNGQSLTPYIGVGAGAVKGEFEFFGPYPTAPNGPGVAIVDNDQTNVGWQAMAGFSVPLSGNMAATAQFRYFDAGTFSTAGFQGRNTAIDVKGSSWDVGLRWGF